MKTGKKNFLRLSVAKLKRRARRSPEHLIQCQLVAWIGLRFPEALICASAGGMRTSKGTAIKMKLAGYRKGFPDLFIYEPSRGFHGLAIELKSEDGRPSKEQIAWIKALNDRGFYATVCKGFDEAAATVEAYFKPETKPKQ